MSEAEATERQRSPVKLVASRMGRAADEVIKARTRLTKLADQYREAEAKLKAAEAEVTQATAAFQEIQKTK